MIQRILMGIVIGKIVNKGIDYASRGGKDPATMTPEERAKAQRMGKMGRQARKFANMGRRLR
ncbi:hypothetical protein [Falsirhodobacter halotolerans]|uniref:hypothetical protein n=1 Tax=Falsirhodobacter halotolerans TaxID=1146892 RepID=UPI001FD5CF70|nr:hypothetical protein [Falsirhodobacter halotolerans]MCJ8139747.1 hypothetical protein [Falsirhodobacter halotolerans]